MALTIENLETERLIAEVAALAGETQAEAVRKALEERKQRLAASLSPVERIARWRRFLETRVWPNLPPDARGKRISREELDDILGYGPEGV
jgi:antitoxin VapB